MERSLMDVLLELPDVRHAKGKRHELAKVIILVVLALLCGHNSLRQIAKWGRHLDTESRQRLGNGHGKVGSYSTIRRVLLSLEAVTLARALQSWVEEVLAAYPQPSELVGLALDGKTLRGSGDSEADIPALQVLNAVVHNLAVVLDSQAVPAETNELGAMPDFLEPLLLKERVVTSDALHAQRDQAQTILQKEGHYLLRIKNNQPRTLTTLQAWFQAQPSPMMPRTRHIVTQKGHGRLVRYTIQTTTALNTYLQDELAWPKVGQTLCIERRATCLKTGCLSTSYHYALTDLTPLQADPTTLFRLWQHHWHIENKLHWVRDVDFAEDRSRVRTGSLPLVLSLLRNAVISLLRLYGYDRITDARTFFSLNVPLACSFVGIPLI